MQRINLVGQHFGRLVVIQPHGLNSNKHLEWFCECECGAIVSVRGLSLRNGDTQSCGCLRSELMRSKQTKHGAYFNRSKRERLYNIYADMKQRCLDKTCEPYKDYGGRGITICDEWITDYTAFKSWALGNGYSESLTIDRINNDGNYEPCNCRWTDAVTQANNKRQGRLPDRDELTGRFMPDRRT